MSRNKKVAGDPRNLARRTISFQHHRAEHVERQRNDHQVRAPAVHRPNQPAERNLGRQKTNALVGGRFTRLVVHQQQHAGNDLHDEKEHRDPAQVIPPHPMRSQRHLFVTQELEQRRELITPVQPAAQASRFSALFISGLSGQKRRFHRRVDVERGIWATVAAAARTTRGR